MASSPAHSAPDGGASGAGTRINGVDLAALRGEVDAIRSHPDAGRFSFRAINRWLHGGHSRTTVKHYRSAAEKLTNRSQPVVVDTELAALSRGSDRAMSPLELLLAALASCLSTTLVWCASIRGRHLDAVETRVEGDIDLAGLVGARDRGPPAYRAIRVTVQVESDMPDTELENLLAAATRLSPVCNTICSSTLVDVVTCVISR